MKQRFFSTILMMFLCMGTCLKAQTQTVWWGLWNDGQGLAAVDELPEGTNDLCIRLLASQVPAMVGSNIHGLRFYISDKTAVTSAKAWISTRTFNWNSGEPTTTWIDIPLDDLRDWNNDHAATEVLFDQPYVVLPSANPYANAYIGFTLVLSNDVSTTPCEMMTAGRLTDDRNSNFWNWQGIENEYGPLALQLLVSSDTFADYGIKPLPLDTNILMAGVEQTFDMQFKSDGIAAVTDFDYVVTASGSTLAEEHFELPAPTDAMGTDITVPVTLTMPDEAKAHELQVCVTRVNGKDNQSLNPIATSSVILLDQMATKRVVMEEFTGTWCANCPRGMVGMHLLEEKYGDRFIGIAIHNDDPMMIASYDNSSFKRTWIAKLGGYPGCVVDRSVDCDPYSGLSVINTHFLTDAEVVAPRMATQTCVADVDITATWLDEEQKTIHYDVATTFRYSCENEAPYALVLVLTANGLTGTESGWEQVNKYAEEDNIYTDDDMSFWISAGRRVKNQEYDHVAIAVEGVNSGLTNSITYPFSAGVAQHFPFDLDVSSNYLIQDKDRLRAIALLLDTRTGEIVNAASAPVISSETTGITQFNAAAESTGAPRYYTLDGRSLMQPQRGVTIVRQADGNTRKIWVK